MKYIYWDSNCFIGYLKDEEYGRDARKGVVQAVERGEATLVTSVFTMVEVVKYKVKGTGELSTIGRRECGALEDCFSPENGVLLINVDRETAAMARRAVWDYNVDPKDAIHVGSALQFTDVMLDESDEFVFQTFDKKLIKRAQGCGGIKFEEPNVADYPYQLSADFGE